MVVTFTSIMTSIFIGTIILMVLFLLSKLLNKHKLITSKVLVMFVFLFLIRMAVPVELGYTITIPSRFLMPAVQSILSLSIFTISGKPVLVLYFFVAVWVLGAIKKLFGLFSNYKHLMKICKRYSSNSDFVSKNNKKVRVLFLSQKSSPMVIGIFQPVLLMPRLDLTDKEINYIINHELIHISNFDLLIKYCYEIVLCCYWWNPIFFLFRKQLNQVLEIRADDGVVQELSEDEKTEYVKTLLKVSRQVLVDKKQSAYSASFSATNQRALIQRSQNILCKKRTIGKIGMMLLFSAFFLFSTSVIFEPSSIDEETQSSTFSISSSNSYFIQAKDGSYDLYVEHEFIVIIPCSRYHQSCIRYR